MRWHTDSATERFKNCWCAPRAVREGVRSEGTKRNPRMVAMLVVGNFSFDRASR